MLLADLPRSFFHLPQVCRAQAVAEQAAPARAHQPGPAESLYLQLSDVGLDPGRVFKVRGASLDRAAIHITLDDGTIAFTKDVLGRITGAFFEGDGEVLLAPPNDVERRSMSLFTGMAILEERFSTAYFRFNDNTAAELQPGLRAPEDAQEFVARWDETARNLAQTDAMRLLASFQRDAADRRRERLQRRNGRHALQIPKIACFMPGCRGTNSASSTSFTTRLPGNRSRPGKARPGRRTGTCITTSGLHSRPRIEDGIDLLRAEIPQTLPAGTESLEDPIWVRSYVIDARGETTQGTGCGSDVAARCGARRIAFLVFELSRFLQIQTVEADGKAVEFIQNPAVEGTRLARSGNDLVAVILPEPARKGQKISLRFVYGGEVLAEAGKGLLYVGAARHMVSQSRNGDGRFRSYLPLSAGLDSSGDGQTRAALPSHRRQPPQPAPPERDDEQVAHWVSERPIPVAGFDLGKYVRGYGASRKCHGGNLRYERRGTRLPTAAATGSIQRSEAHVAASRLSRRWSPSRTFARTERDGRGRSSQLGRFATMPSDSVRFPTVNWL